MLRVLHIVRKMDHGGVQSMIMNYYRNIDKEKIQFDFLELELGDSFYKIEIESLGGRIFKIEAHDTYFKLLYSFCRFLILKRPSAIHTHLNWLNAIFLFASLLFFIPVRISHSHNLLPEARGFDGFVKKITRLVINISSTHRFSCSMESAAWLYGLKSVGSTNYMLVKNAIATKKFSYKDLSRNLKRSELEIKNELLIGHIGHFNTQKNHVFILEIFKELAYKKPDAVLILVGVGDWLLVMIEMAKSYGIDHRVRFLGDRTDVPELLSAFDIFLFPSLHEGLPFVLLEAQAAGLPCVISDVITQEAIVGEGVYSFSLKDSAKVWATKIATVDLSRRYNNPRLIESSGYDISQAAKELQAQYVQAFACI